MIVIAIIGILAAVAVPQYGQYTKRAKFADVVSQVAPYKTAVSLCIQDLDTKTGCNTGVGDIGPAITAGSNTGSLNTLTVADGLISAAGTSDVSSATFTLTPTFNSTNNTLTWAKGGDCLTKKLCK